MYLSGLPAFLMLGSSVDVLGLPTIPASPFCSPVTGFHFMTPFLTSFPFRNLSRQNVWSYRCVEVSQSLGRPLIMMIDEALLENFQRTQRMRGVHDLPHVTSLNVQHRGVFPLTSLLSFSSSLLQFFRDEGPYTSTTHIGCFFSSNYFVKSKWKKSAKSE